MEKIHAEERKMWEAERDRQKEKIVQAVWETMQEQRKLNQVSIILPFHGLVLCIFCFFLMCGRFSCDICHSSLHQADICNAQQSYQFIFIQTICMEGSWHIQNKISVTFTDTYIEMR